MVNLNGELIGINTAILGASGGNVGIGFAIPSNMMKNLVDQIVEYGEVRRGSLGILGRTLDAGLAKAQGFEVKRGAYVMRVVEDSAADKAGLKANDVIVSLNGDEIESFNELHGKVATMGEGREVRLGVYRDGKTKFIDVELGGKQEEQANAEDVHPNLRGAVLESGERNGNEGVVITSIEPRSPAARVGLEEGDVIMQVNRKRVTSVKDMSKLIDGIKGNIVLGIKRDRETVFYLIQ